MPLIETAGCVFLRREIDNPRLSIYQREDREYVWRAYEETQSGVPCASPSTCSPLLQVPY
jgi:hypothetical protein